MTFSVKVSTLNSCNITTFFRTWAANNKNGIMLINESALSALGRRLQAAGKLGIVNLEPESRQKLSYAGIDVEWYNVGGQKCILDQIKHEGEVVYTAPETWEAAEDICLIR